MSSVVFNGFGGWTPQSSSIVPALVPASAVDGELLVLFVATDAQGEHFTPDGWRLQANARNGVSTAAPNISIYSKISSGEPDHYNVQVESGVSLGAAGIAHLSLVSDAQTGSTDIGTQHLMNPGTVTFQGAAGRSSVSSSVNIRCPGITVNPEEGLTLYFAAFVADTYPEGFGPNSDTIALSTFNVQGLTMGIFQSLLTPADYSGMIELQSTRAASSAAITFKVAGPHETNDTDLTLMWMGI